MQNLCKYLCNPLCKIIVNYIPPEDIIFKDDFFAFTLIEQYTYHTLSDVVRNNRQKMLEHIYNIYPTIFSMKYYPHDSICHLLIYDAIYYEYTNLIKWIYDTFKEYNFDDILNEALSNGKTKSVKFIYENIIKKYDQEMIDQEIIDQEMIDDAIDHDYVDMLKYLNSKFRLDIDIKSVNYDCEHSYEMIKFLHKNNYDFNIGFTICNAIEKGDLKMVKLLKTYLTNKEYFKKYENAYPKTKECKVYKYCLLNKSKNKKEKILKTINYVLKKSPDIFGYLAGYIV
jgi:hypothetical protein